MFKKWTTILVALAVALSGFAFVASPAFAMSTGKAVIKAKNGTFTSSMLRPVVKTEDTTNGNLLKGKTYVIFHLNKSEESAFKSGRMGIYSYNNRTRTYTKLSAFLVSVGKGIRVAAIGTRFGNYSFGSLAVK